MDRRLFRQLLLAGLVVAATACSDSGASTTTAIITSPGSGTALTFPSAPPGTLTINGAATFLFTATTSGAISAKLTTLTPNTAVGLWLGVWDGARCAFGTGRADALQYDPALLDTDPAQKGLVSAYATGGGNYCARIYDADGASSHTYQIDLIHP